MRRTLTTGEKGWAGLLGYVIVIDSIAWRHQTRGLKDETMSVVFGKSLQHPVARIGTLLVWGLVTLHLFWSLPLPLSKTLKKIVTRGVK